MNEAARKPVTQEIVVDEIFPHAPEIIWKTLTTGRADRPLAHGADRLRSREGQPLHLSDQGRRRVGRHHSLRSAGGDPEPAPGL